MGANQSSRRGARQSSGRGARQSRGCGASTTGSAVGTFPAQLFKIEVDHVEKEVQKEKYSFLFKLDFGAVRGNTHEQEREIKQMIIAELNNRENVECFRDHSMWIEFEKSFPGEVLGASKNFGKFELFKMVLVNHVRTLALQHAKNGETQETHSTDVAETIDDPTTETDGKEEDDSNTNSSSCVRFMEKPNTDPQAHIPKDLQTGDMQQEGPRKLNNSGEAHLKFQFATVDELREVNNGSP